MLAAFGICRGDRADFLFDSTALPPGITCALFSIASSGVFGCPKDCPVDQWQANCVHRILWVVLELLLQTNQ